MPKRILILGGYGETGRRLAYHLVNSTDANIIIAGRHLDRAEELATTLQSTPKPTQSTATKSDSNASITGRISTAFVDASDSSSLLDAMRNHSVDILVVAAPTTQYTENVIRACLTAGVNYLDVQLSKTKLDLLRRYQSDIKDAGLCFITESGFHPGLPSALVRYAAAKMEAAAAGTQIKTAVVGGYLNMGHDLPYTDSVDELMVELAHYRGQVYTHSKWTMPSSYSMRKIDFGNDSTNTCSIGTRYCYSVYMEELDPLTEMYPSLHELGFYMAGSNWLTDFLIFPIVYLGMKLFPKRGIRPLGQLLWWGMRQSPPPHLCALQIEATGHRTERASVEEKRICFRTRVEHKDGFELTAIPVVACLMQYLGEEKRKRPGLHMMGHYIDPVQAMDDMESMGIRVVKEGLK